MNHPHRYDFAITYADEDRDFAKPLYDRLDAEGLKGFIDVDAEADLLGKHRPTHLAELFANDTEYVVLALSGAYFDQVWQQVELRGAIATAIRTKRDYILPVRLDDAEWPVLLQDIGFVDARERSPEAVARVIGAKLRGGAEPPVPLTEAPLDPPVLGLHRFPRHAKPEFEAAVVPFKVDESLVDDRFREWARGRWRAREDFRRLVSAGARRAVFVPYWVGEADLYVEYKGSTQIQPSAAGTSAVQTQPPERVSVNREFLHRRYQFARPAFIPDVEFGQGFAKHLAAVRPGWSLDERIAATPERLSGFDLIGRSVSAQEAANDWHPFSDDQLAAAIRADLGGAYQTIGTPRTRAGGVEAEIRFLPVWVVDWEFEGERGRVLINGQTGVAAGSEYRSAWKTLMIAAGCVAAVMLLFALLNAGVDDAQSPGEGAGSTGDVTETTQAD
ncbi:toll/interleukin-1 receptor domain-containing protein [Glycomyces luteolus]|uniref:Toll/interleukin-1 receptor domain-containing protein n=1 Tax=Glycomyces luteolus TaxID=2670330 RepID=A0A9X3PDZ2_9ACTN|nr:toll/interleukin-1 receptor domain-containing protein [Glycomyces luteolus]MDA1361740.1 toll/interleukin-1 receptor domain-containing protein [Glycomyces luteolus]